MSNIVNLYTAVDINAFNPRIFPYNIDAPADQIIRQVAQNCNLPLNQEYKVIVKTGSGVDLFLEKDQTLRLLGVQNGNQLIILGKDSPIQQQQQTGTQIVGGIVPPHLQAAAAMLTGNNPPQPGTNFNSTFNFQSTLPPPPGFSTNNTNLASSQLPSTFGPSGFGQPPGLSGLPPPPGLPQQNQGFGGLPPPPGLGGFPSMMQPSPSQFDSSNFQTGAVFQPLNVNPGFSQFQSGVNLNQEFDASEFQSGIGLRAAPKPTAPVKKQTTDESSLFNSQMAFKIKDNNEDDQQQERTTRYMLENGIVIEEAITDEITK